MSKQTYMKETPEAVFTRIYKNGILPFLKETFEDATPVALFWNALAYIAFIITACFSIEAAGIISGVASLFLLAAVLDDEFENNPNTHYWPPLSFLFWFFILLACIFGIGYGLWYITIRPFNNWLNNPHRFKRGMSWDKFNAIISNPTTCPTKFSEEFSLAYQSSTIVRREDFYYQNPAYWTAQYKSIMNCVNPEHIWTTAAGQSIDFKDLDHQHLSNILWYREIFNKKNFNNCDIQVALIDELKVRFKGNRLNWKPLPIPQEVAWLKENHFIDKSGSICYNGHIIGSISHITNWQTI